MHPASPWRGPWQRQSAQTSTLSIAQFSSQFCAVPAASPMRWNAYSAQACREESDDAALQVGKKCLDSWAHWLICINLHPRLGLSSLWSKLPYLVGWPFSPPGISEQRVLATTCAAQLTQPEPPELWPWPSQWVEDFPVLALGRFSPVDLPSC